MSIRHTVWFKPSVSLLIFYLVILSTIESGIFNGYAEMSISLFNSVQLRLTVFYILMLGVYIFIILNLLITVPLINIQYLPLSLAVVFDLKSILSKSSVEPQFSCVLSLLQFTWCDFSIVSVLTYLCLQI